MDQSRMTFLQNVLRYSTSHSDGTSSEESHVREMSPERKKWLENALDNMSINPVEEMKKCIKCLNDPAQEENHLTALETLRDWCEDMNFAIGNKISTTSQQSILINRCFCFRFSQVKPISAVIHASKQ